MIQNYVHGYTDFENQRLSDQAKTLDSLLHYDSLFPKDSRILEVGCGTGAQTEIICRMNPGIRLTSVDLSLDSIRLAEERCRSLGFMQVNFQQANIYNLPFVDQSFDHVFICFVLEHLPDVSEALKRIRSVIKPGGTITVIEGDHGSAYYFPQSAKAQQTINCLIELQALEGGDSLIGRRLYPLLNAHQFKDVSVSPRMVYADASVPQMVDGFTFKTFIAMVEGVKESALDAGLMNEEDWDQGICELRRSGEKDGVFCYTFFKAIGKVY